ncbi:helix-turn-helix domain-containing protein [Peptococcus niger]|uniref:Helix-turn-helix domain-containing protein n=1 Tax=Peptococcus niger TaxID=2741 RepID=A0A1G6RL69_PEPNI|nr:helix-turn-helix domain-containing protein [Peptococcus niger]SDD05399.1 hypothetical protein SAMN04489866_10158 [Peptococcus niger]
MSEVLQELQEIKAFLAELAEGPKQYPDFLTCEELAEYLGMGIQAARELGKSPGFPRIQYGRRVMYPRDLVKQEMERRSRAEYRERMAKLRI